MERVADYIAGENLRQALTFIQELRTSCLELADTPEGFALVPRYERHGIRRKIHGIFLIFYRVQRERIIIIHGVNMAGVIATRERAQPLRLVRLRTYDHHK